MCVISFLEFQQKFETMMIMVQKISVKINKMIIIMFKVPGLISMYVMVLGNILAFIWQL